MMATQPYPSPQMQSAPNTGSRNIYRINTNQPSSSPGPPSGGGMYYPPQPQYMHHYSPQHDVSAYGLVTPPASSAPQFGSPIMPQGYYGSSASSQWSLNGLVSPLSSDGMSLPGYYVPSPLLGNDPHCAAPGEVFSSHSYGREPMAGDALGFTNGVPVHHHQMYGVQTHIGKPGQHMIVGPDGQPAQAEPKKRSRTAQACERCRIRKARCFGGNPCNRCTKRRFVCEFSTAVRQRGPNKPPAAGVNASSNSVGVDANGVSAPGSATNPLKPLSIDTKATRRHSADSITQAAPLASMHPAPAKGYSSNDIPLAQATATATTPDGYPATSAQVTPPEYLSVPNNGQRPQTDHGYYGTRSPVFSFEGEYPISPATTFSSVNTLPLPNYEHDHPQVWYTAAA